MHCLGVVEAVRAVIAVIAVMTVMAVIGIMAVMGLGLDFAFAGELHVGVYHHVYEFLEGCFAGVPAQGLACFGGVAE